MIEPAFLGKSTPLPSSPEEARLDYVPNPRAGSLYLVRFAAPEFKVECDNRHTVWVKRTDGSRSFGCPPWLLRQRSVKDVLETVEAKLRMPVSPIA